MASRWGNSENSDRLFFGASKSLQMVTLAMKLKEACSLKKTHDQPKQHIKKQRHYFANKGLSSQSYVLPVVMYVCERWTIKKTEHQRIELQCWRRLLRVPWTARRSNQSILKEINPKYSLERLTLKLKLQYFGHLTFRPKICTRLQLRKRSHQQRRVLPNTAGPKNPGAVSLGHHWVKTVMNLSFQTR